MVRNAVRARTPYINEISRRLSSQYFLITRQKEKCGHLRSTLLLAQSLNLPACLSLSHSTFTHNPTRKIFFPVRAHAERMTVIQRNTLASAGGFTFAGIIPGGTPSRVQFFLFLCPAFPFLFFIFFVFFVLYVYMCVHEIVVTSSSAKLIRVPTLGINSFHAIISNEEYNYKATLYLFFLNNNHL